MPEPLETVLAYHERTKHRPDQYAAGPGSLDWANQPEPFRIWDGARVTELPLAADRLFTRYGDVFSAGAVQPRPMGLESLSVLLELALGLSAWKSGGGGSWALRCNPSSGNLHPTEGYLLASRVEGVPDGVHHYNPYLHALEQRAEAVLPVPDGCAVVGLASVHWREAWKYGERAWRYCQHDAGHAIAAVRIAAGALGWGAVLLDAPGDDDVAAVLGLDRAADFGDAEREHPDALLVVGPAPRPEEFDSERMVAALRTAGWTGVANRLSAEHRDWPVIEEAATAARKPRTAKTPSAAGAGPRAEAAPDDSGATAVSVIRKRRSAQSFDGVTGISSEDFRRVIARLASHRPPWDALPWGPLVHPVFILHRVEGLTPGLYAAPRTPEAVRRLQSAMDPSFLWERVDEADGVPLYLLKVGDGREAGRFISCNQAIAGDSAFTLGMLADYEATLSERGPWWYRRLFWESGVLGHVLYLEAEAVGLRGTGIGCYFDDVFHEALGLQGRTFQSLYHFTVGAPVDDARLQTWPPYGHRKP